MKRECPKLYHVYFAQSTSNGHTKIGITSLPIQMRVHGLANKDKGANHRAVNPVQVWYAVPTFSRSTEKWFHRYFSKSHLHGEWYDIRSNEAEKAIALYLLANSRIYIEGIRRMEKT